MNKICVVYTHGKLGDLIWQLPYIKAISDFHNQKITLISRPTTHAKILYKDLNYIDAVSYTHLPSPRDVEESRMPSSA